MKIIIIICSITQHCVKYFDILLFVILKTTLKVGTVVLIFWKNETKCRLI